MKKKTIVICAAAAIIAACAWLLLRPQALGNISASFTEKTTSISDFTFSAEPGDRVKFSFQSDIAAGNLEIIVYSSNGDAVYVLDHAKALETFFTFEASDTYTLQAEYTDFIGSFKITVYPASES